MNDLKYIIILLFCCILPIKAQEKLLLAGSGNTSILLINKKEGTIEWEHVIGTYEQGIECNSIDITHDGKILFAYKKGVKLIDWAHNTLWNYPSPQGCEIHSASILPEGGFLLAINGNPTRIIELTPQGRTRDSIIVKEDLGNNPHMQCRQIRKANNGNYLVSVLGKPQLYEIDHEGNTTRCYNLKGGAFSVVEMNQGDLILPLGDTHAIQIIQRQSGEEISYIQSNGLQGYKLLFAGQIQKLNNGHWMIANWARHENTSNAPQIIEFDLTGKVYWTLNDKKYGNVSTFCPLY